MLKTLDWYIIKKYLGSFFFTALIFTLIGVIIDFSQKVEDFIEEEIGIKQILFEHYFNFIPHINSLLWPLFAMIAVIFFTSRMAYNSEIISILNAGVSYRRLMVPYIISAALIGGLHLWGNHLIVPEGNKKRVEFFNTYVKKNADKGKTNDLHFFMNPETKVIVDNYIKKDTTARGFTLERFEEGRLTYLLKARYLEWIGPPNRWRIKNFEVRTFNKMTETYSVQKRGSLDTVLNIIPKDFVKFKNERERMTTPEIMEHIRSELSKGKGNTKIFEVEVHRRTADTFTIFILSILGMSVASRKVRGGMGLHLAIGTGLGALYIFLSKFSTTFATNGDLSPFMAVWLPNVIFIFVAIFLVYRAQK